LVRQERVDYCHKNKGGKGERKEGTGRCHIGLVETSGVKTLAYH